MGFSYQNHLEGLRFGRLLVGKQEGKTKAGTLRWNCLCDCGRKVNLVGARIKSGETKSCGCIRVELLIKRNTQFVRTHGGTGTPEFNAWLGMKNRCYVKSSGSYKNYGARGILVCDRWRHSFENFLEDMGRRPSRGHSLDRIDVYGNYEKANCRWATSSEQNRNKRRSVAIIPSVTMAIVRSWAVA